jgi:hypothetical protein
MNIFTSLPQINQLFNTNKSTANECVSRYANVIYINEGHGTVSPPSGRQGNVTHTIPHLPFYL